MDLRHQKASWRVKHFLLSNYAVVVVLLLTMAIGNGKMTAATVCFDSRCWLAFLGQIGWLASCSVTC